MNSPFQPPVSRRRFLKASTAAVAAVPFLGSHSRAQSANSKLRLGLIGCGGRGTGAAAQALRADSNTQLVAMADVFSERLQTSLKTLKEQSAVADRVEVPETRQFLGFDAYNQVIASGVDVVLLATPPHFRPMHIKAAIDAGKHVFAEKPVAVDAPGVRSVLETCAEAKRKNLSVVSGLALRYANGYRETIRRIHAGELGEIRALQANDFRGPIWVKPRQPGWTDMEYHMHNWYYFTWLSGDFNVEQHIHMLDVCAWVMKDQYPVSAMGIGGRQVRTGPEHGNIYDHHSVIYEYEDGTKLFANCRQQAGTVNDISTQVIGSRGSAVMSSRAFEIRTDARWRFDGQANDPFVTEHEELLGSIRRGEAINNGEYMSKSTLMAVMGRMATYTGQKITWDQAMSSREKLAPSSYSWDAAPPPSEVAIPGVTKFL